jgi:pyruvate/2-oxoglutarate/acetoin dehydrogenase E1 component
MRHASVEAAELLAGEGVSVEVIDPRTLVPFDYTAVFESIDRTHHLVVAQEASFGGSWGATVVARSTQDRFDSFDAPPLVVGGDDTPSPMPGCMGALGPANRGWRAPRSRLLM